MDMIAVRLGTRQCFTAALRSPSCPKHCVTSAADPPQPDDLGRHITRRASRPDPPGPDPPSGSFLRRRGAGALAGLGYGTFCVRRWCRNELHTGFGAALSLLKHTVLIARELSTSIRTLQSETAKSENRKFFFDTHAVVRLLENSGFSSQQAEVVVSALMRTTNSNMDIIYKDMVTKVQQKVKIEVLQLKVQLNDVMNKVRSDSILEMNLEKSRVKEMRAEYERKVLAARTQMMEMNSEQDRQITQTNMKIDTEVAGLKTMLESHKLDTVKYLAGSVFTCLTVVLGFYRIWM
ncbi:mitochondrial calcium uniporter regulator 1 isoform X2 [Brienomyrus brachyistius]|uniref:mitochondrial calcium uniporter regulator 1 isoform X2 n=1 Tax=Brienomyrus brachyistius TaxID=42636 RepID=UPI0020B23923|nr:mitochondrial calcium uniporter regulator 1 isoform X2 [Brienomyrus brachyistius]